MNILVTGGTGYIGSHACVALIEQKHNVVICDNFSNSSPKVVNDIERITGVKPAISELDIRDTAKLDECFRENKIDAVIHFAGLKAVGESVEKPIEYYDNNIGGTISLINSMEKAGVRRIVFSSSATVYGAVNPAPFSETATRYEATNPYGQTKIMIERILVDLAAAKPDWSIALLRYFNPIGAHESGLIGEEPNGIPNNLVPYIAKVAAGKLDKVYVFGDDYETRDGTGIRDYLHVLDLADGHVNALDYVAAHRGVEAVNLGTGKGQSVLEIIHAYEKACGKPLPYEVVARRAGDIAECYADTRKAKELYGWTAKRDLAKMCEDSWRFASRNL